jgi:hypothetical protein
MSLHAASAAPISIFRDDEPVIQSHPLLPSAVVPRFADTGCWDLNGVVRRTANRPPYSWRIVFHGLPAGWNLRARELAMIWLNPRHPKVLERDVHLRPQPAAPGTVNLRMHLLRGLAAWAVDRGLLDELRRWDPRALHDYIEHLRGHGLAEASLVHRISLVRSLYRLDPALADGGLSADPWPDSSSASALKLVAAEDLSTPAINPEIWFPLVGAAWAYIDTLGPDILRAHALWQRLRADARYIEPSRRQALVEHWLADPTNRVPLRPPHWNSPDLVNWSLLAHMMGADPEQTDMFGYRKSTARRRRHMIQDAVAQGRVQSGLLGDLRIVERPDGTAGPWHECLTPRALWLECVALRNAAYTFVSALSMMRDSEVREITKDSVVEHYGSQAVVSRKVKLDPDLPNRHWWITEPVAQAITTASQLSRHADLAFSGATAGRPADEQFDSGEAIVTFIAYVNRYRHVTGLAHIPDGKVTPHMFRRTMAMLTSEFPGSEIAVGMQLKHMATRALANRHTQGYSAQTPAWAKYFDTAAKAARFEKLRDLYDAHRRGDTIGYGPGADSLTRSFDAVAHAADELRAAGQARHGDARVEYDFLRKTQLSLRFGKLNHCAMNDADPTGAKCVEDAVIPDGHHGPLIDRCQPGRCGNSIIAPGHLPIWKAEEQSLLTLLDTPKAAPGRRAQLQHQLDDVRAVIRRTQQ